MTARHWLSGIAAAFVALVGTGPSLAITGILQPEVHDVGTRQHAGDASRMITAGADLAVSVMVVPGVGLWRGWRDAAVPLMFLVVVVLATAGIIMNSRSETRPVDPHFRATANGTDTDMAAVLAAMRARQEEGRRGFLADCSQRFDETMRAIERDLHVMGDRMAVAGSTGRDRSLQAKAMVDALHVDTRWIGAQLVFQTLHREGLGEALLQLGGSMAFARGGEIAMDVDIGGSRMGDDLERRILRGVRVLLAGTGQERTDRLSVERSGAQLIVDHHGKGIREDEAEAAIARLRTVMEGHEAEIATRAVEGGERFTSVIVSLT